MMKQTLRALALMAAFVAAVGVVSSVLSESAIAQIRAALVRDTDSPVRGIRHFENLGGAFSGGSTGQTVTPTVPAGKRLFLQSLSMTTKLTGTTPIESRFYGMTGSSLTTGLIYIDQRLQGVFNGGSFFTGNRDINMMLNPGESIRIDVSASNPASNDYFSATVIGYLVDANP
jgi:hypothetical protein